MYVCIGAVSDKEHKKSPYYGKSMRVSAPEFVISSGATGHSAEPQARTRACDRIGTGKRYEIPIETTRDLIVYLTQDDLLRIVKYALSRRILLTPSLEQLREFADAIEVVCKQYGVPKAKGRPTQTSRSIRTRARMARISQR